MRRLSSVLGLVIGAAGIAFVAREVATGWSEIAPLLLDASAGLLILAFLVGMSAMLTIGFGWRRCLHLLGQRHPTDRALRAYFVGQLGKYVPGGIWPVVGRGEMARRDGVPGAIAYGSTLLSLAMTYLAAVLTAAGFLVLDRSGGAGRWAAVLFLLPVGVLALHPRVVSLALSSVRRLTRRQLEIPVPPWGASIALLFLHVPAWLAIGTATWLVVTALDPGGSSYANVVFATSLSWFVGFVAIGVPGGIGVREAVFVATAVSVSGSGVAAAVSVLARLVFITVDVTGAAAASAVVARKTDRHVTCPRGDDDA